jgi:hypothetical protein
MNHLPAPIAAQPWLEAARVAVIDVARRALGAIVTFTVSADRGGEGRGRGEQELAGAMGGALVPIVSELAPVQIGLFSSDAGCAALARALLVRGAHEPLTRAEIVDAVGEIVNMLCGAVKARVARYASRAVLGLPTFVHGPIEARRQQVVEVLPVTIGEAAVLVVVLHT